LSPEGGGKRPLGGKGGEGPPIHGMKGAKGGWGGVCGLVVGVFEAVGPAGGGGGVFGNELCWGFGAARWGPSRTSLPVSLPRKKIGARGKRARKPRA